MASQSVLFDLPVLSDVLSDIIVSNSPAGTKRCMDVLGLSGGSSMAKENLSPKLLEHFQELYKRDAGQAADDPDDEYGALKCKELKSKLRQRGLRIRGKKADLLARLRNADKFLASTDMDAAAAGEEQQMETDGSHEDSPWSCGPVSLSSPAQN